MSETLGNVATVEVSTDGGANYSAVGEVKDPSFAVAQDIVDSTTNDDGGWKANLRAQKQATLSFTVNYDEVDAGQKKIMDAHYAGTGLSVRWRPMGAVSGKRSITFAADTPSVTNDTATQGASEMSIELQSSGTVTFGTVT